MENNGIFDINNATHLAVLHYVFPVRIQNELTIWKNAHNFHSVRTESNQSPLQLWHKSTQMSFSHQQYTAISNIFARNLNEYLPLIQFYED